MIFREDPDAKRPNETLDSYFIGRLRWHFGTFGRIRRKQTQHQHV
jgi:hypothetical protein